MPTSKTIIVSGRMTVEFSGYPIIVPDDFSLEDEDNEIEEQLDYHTILQIGDIPTIEIFDAYEDDDKVKL